jgi:thioredoxin 1
MQFFSFRFPFRQVAVILESRRKIMSEIVLNSSNFEEEVLGSKTPVLVDFWATWCGPCRMLAPVIAQIAVKYEGTVKVGKVDVDENPELAESFNVSSIPTLILFKDGKPVAQRTGGAPMPLIEAFIKDNI